MTKCHSFATFLSFLTLAATAQTSQNLNTVEVRGRKKTVKERAEFQRHAQTTEVITEEELNRNNPAFIEQSLGTVAGVQVDKRTQLGGQRIVIRGYGNDQKFNNWGVKAYYNNIPLTTADGVTVLDDLDFTTVDNIEVIKGPAATEYGAGVGGVVRFYLKPTGAPGVTLSNRFTAGSFGLLQDQTRIDAIGDNYALAANYTHIQTDGYRPHGAGLKNLFSSFGEFRLNKRQKLSYFLSHNVSQEEVSGQISYADYYAGIDNGNPAYIKKNARNDFQTTRVGVSHFWTIGAGVSNYTTLFYSNSDYKRVAAGADENSMNPNYGVRSVFDWRKDLGRRFANDLEVGTELQQSRSLISNYRFTGTNDSIPLQVGPIAGGASYFKNTSNQRSFFAIERLTYKPWDLTLVAGVSTNTISYNRIDLLAPAGLLTGYNKDQSFDKAFATAYNPHIALQKRWKGQIFQASYSEGYNAPTAATAYVAATGRTNDGLVPEKARMAEVSVQGLLFGTRFDYQVSVFQMTVEDKLTQLSGVNPANGTAYAYWANTGTQKNRGAEASLGYVWTPKPNAVLAKVEPFASASYYEFTYTDFATRIGTAVTDFSGKQVVGVPKTRYTIGLDLTSPQGIYLNGTYNSMGDVYTDFANTNEVAGYTQLNAKLGYRRSFGKLGLDMDVFAAGNNLTDQINYTFLFLGNSVGDADAGSGYPKGVATDVNPGPSQAYFFGGVSFKKRF